MAAWSAVPGPADQQSSGQESRKSSLKHKVLLSLKKPQFDSFHPQFNWLHTRTVGGV